MVQNPRGEVRESLTDRLRRLFRSTRIVETPLDFTVGTDEQGKQVIEAYLTIEGQKQQVKDITKLWSYGYALEKDGTRYVLDRESINTLLSIRALNPEVTAGGKIIADINPAILKYLRQQHDVSEDATSRRIEIHDEPLKHRAEVQYDPQKGMQVKAGYEVPGREGVVKLNDFDKSSNTEYARLGNVFYCLPQEENPRVKTWVETQEKTVDLDDIPEFFKRDLVLLKSNFNAVLTEQANKIQVIDEPFKPVVTVSNDDRGWLNFTITYEAGAYKLPYSLFKDTDKDYVQQGDMWIKVDHAVVEETGNSSPRSALSRQIAATA